MSDNKLYLNLLSKSWFDWTYFPIRNYNWTYFPLTNYTWTYFPITHYNWTYLPSPDLIDGCSDVKVEGGWVSLPPRFKVNLKVNKWRKCSELIDHLKWGFLNCINILLHIFFNIILLCCPELVPQSWGTEPGIFPFELYSKVEFKPKM